MFSSSVSRAPAWLPPTSLVGVGADVVGFDRNEALEAGRLAELDVEVHLGQEEATLLQGIDLVVKSPGVPGQTLLVEGARERDIPVWSEIELGSRLLDNPILGVTGTNGKTTTSELLGAMFRAADTSVEVAGNVGRPLTSLVGHVTPDAWIVCELSSFQLEDVHTLEPRVGVLLNLEPDHLDRHGTFDAYSETKLRMFEHQSADDIGDRAARFRRDPGFGDPSRVRSRRRAAGRAAHSRAAQPRERCRRHRRGALGRDRRRGDRASAAHLRGRRTPHRARPRAARRSLCQRLEGDERRGCASGARVVPGITPPRHPRRPWQARVIRASAARRSEPGDVAYLIGEAADEIARSLAAAGVPCIALGHARRAQSHSAANAASAGDVVLLSPACASFDQFRDFEARGDAFRALVEALA